MGKRVNEGMVTHKDLDIWNAEVETQLIIVRELSFADKKEVQTLLQTIETIGKKLLNFIKYLKNKDTTHAK